MLRIGKNAKSDHAHSGDVTADHTPRTSAAYATSHAPAGSGEANSGGAAGYYQASAQAPTQARALTESESLAREIKDGTLSGFVGYGTMLTGEATFKGMLRVDGHLSGHISSQDGTLIVSSNGQVDANIEVAVAQIHGTVNGDIIASKRVEMGRAARVTGNIQAPALVVEQGAIFEGNCRMAQVKEAQEKRRQEEEERSSFGSSPLVEDPVAAEEVADMSEVAS